MYPGHSLEEIRYKLLRAIFQWRETFLIPPAKGDDNTYEVLSTREASLSLEIQGFSLGLLM